MNRTLTIALLASMTSLSMLLTACGPTEPEPGEGRADIFMRCYAECAMMPMGNNPAIQECIDSCSVFP